MCIVFGVPVVASVNFLAGTKAPLHAQQMLQILSVYVRVRHKGFWGESVTCFRFHANCCPQECPLQTGEVRGGGEGEVKWNRLAERGPLPAFHPRLLTVKWPARFWLQPWFAATQNCVWQMTQHLKTKSSDSIGRAINHVQYPSFSNNHAKAL